MRVQSWWIPLSEMLGRKPWMRGAWPQEVKGSPVSIIIFTSFPYLNHNVGPMTTWRNCPIDRIVKSHRCWASSTRWEQTTWLKNGSQHHSEDTWWAYFSLFCLCWSRNATLKLFCHVGVPFGHDLPSVSVPAIVVHSGLHLEDIVHLFSM